MAPGNLCKFHVPLAAHELLLQSIQPLWKIPNIQSLRWAPQLSIKLLHVFFNCSVSLYVLFPATSNTFGNIPSKNSVRSAPDSTALTQVLHQSHYAHTANCYKLTEKGMEHEGEQR